MEESTGAVKLLTHMRHKVAQQDTWPVMWEEGIQGPKRPTLPKASPLPHTALGEKAFQKDNSSHQGAIT